MISHLSCKLPVSIRINALVHVVKIVALSWTQQGCMFQAPRLLPGELRLVILKEKSSPLPTGYQQLAHVSYEKFDWRLPDQRLVLGIWRH